MQGLGVATDQRSIYMVRVVQDGEPEYLLTLLHPRDFHAHGIPAEAVVGRLADPERGICSDNFSRNARFVEFLHEVIATAGPQDPILCQQAALIRDGDLALVDFRGGEGGHEPENLIGTFRVVGGAIVSYRRNLPHRILSDEGFFQLPAGLDAALLAALRQRVGRG
jgi:hypothetical protein